MPNMDDDSDDVWHRILDDRDEGWPNARELIRRPRENKNELRQKLHVRTRHVIFMRNCLTSNANDAANATQCSKILRTSHWHGLKRVK